MCVRSAMSDTAHFDDTHVLRVRAAPYERVGGLLSLATDARRPPPPPPRSIQTPLKQEALCV